LEQSEELKATYRIAHQLRDALADKDFEQFKVALIEAKHSPISIVDYLLEQSEELKATYRIAHQLRDALADKDFEQFKVALIEAKHSPISKGLRRLIRTFTKLLPYIENTFNYPYTNGPIEGLNNKIKVLKRNAYGYRNFEHFKARIFLMMKLYAPDPKKQTLQHKAA
ncbi:transposase, partial [Granulicatella balaenopterae]